MNLEDAIPLSELVEHLRSELLKTAWQGLNREPKFQVVETEIELDVVATNNLGGEAGVQFWVLKADAKTSKETAHTQKIRLKLKPVDSDGRPITVSGGEPHPGAPHPFKPVPPPEPITVSGGEHHPGS